MSIDPTLQLTSSHSVFIPPGYVDKTPRLIDQAYLNDMTRYLKLDAKLAEVLGSRLKDRNLLARVVRITAQRTRHVDLNEYFHQDIDLVYYSNIEAIMQFLDIPIDLSEWRLFIDSSKTSLKGVLLHNGNKYPALPIVYSIQNTEIYGNVQHLLQYFKYEEYNMDTPVICAIYVSGIQDRSTSITFRNIGSYELHI